MIKLLIGGSPCTYWSIAQKNNRETKAEGQGWELFKNYLIAKEKFKPDFFLYENNKSAAQAIKNQIKEELNVWDGTLLMEDSGARYIEINSALVSAQNRQRFYVHNCGDVEQPEDRGILLKDILETGEVWQDKSYTYTTRCQGAILSDTLTKHRHTMVAEPVNITSEGKSQCLRASCYKDGIRNMVGNGIDKRTCVAEPVRIGRYDGGGQGQRIYSDSGKSVTLSSQSGGKGGTTGLYAMKVPEATAKGYAEISEGECVDLTQPNSKTRRGRKMADKSNCLTTSPQFYQYLGATKTYEVKDGLITIKDKQYPIKLKDGSYIIRKLTPVECERLQTLPDNYTAAVSNSQRYKGLGNGWTAEVIIHILSNALKNIPKDEEIVVLSMYDGIATGRYCLDKMGFKNVKYYAYEIDKYAKQVAMSNHPDIIQMGDAFDVRKPDWSLKI